MPSAPHPPSERVRAKMMRGLSFQISVDVADLEQGLGVAEAALRGGVDLVEMGTPLLKFQGVRHVVPAFRRRLPDALLLADMKSMDGGGFEARTVYEGGGNIIDFLALSGEASARAICEVRDEFRLAEPQVPRLAFADILVPQQGSAARAAEAALLMVEAGVDGVGVHLQFDARRAEPGLMGAGVLAEAARAVLAAVGERASVQVVGGLGIATAQELARQGLRAFVISGNLGVADGAARYGEPAEEIERLVRGFIEAVSQV